MRSWRKYYLRLSLAFLAFVVYGSLMPFRLRDMTLAEGWEKFSRLPYLELGAASRADWIANILLYLILAYLFSGWLSSVRAGTMGRVLRGAFVLTLCSVFAISIEFLQTFFSPRTVSSNDLIAEFIGTLLGIILWSLKGRKLEELWQEVRRGGRRALQAALTLYLIAYLVLSLFPYDFLVSLEEWRGKLVGNHWGIAWAGTGGGFLEKLLVTGLEAIAVMPLGILMAVSGRGDGGSSRLLRGLIFGLGLGLVIEALQLGMASGVTQGASVAARGAGVAGGVLLFRLFRDGRLGFVKRLVLPAIILFLVPYLLATLVASGWFRSSLVPLGQGLAKLDWHMLLPFYFHYFTTETRAVMSVLLNATTYFPFGVASWALHFSKWGISLKARNAVIFALIWCFVLESGKMFFAGKHPDYTNLIIAGAAAWAGYWLASWVFAAMRAESSPPLKPDNVFMTGEKSVQ